VFGTKRAGTHLSTAAPGAPEEWQRAVSPDGDFVVEFPGQPKYEARLNAQTGVQVQGYAFPFGDLQFILTFQELLDPPETAAERALRLKEVQTGLLSDKHLSLIRLVRLSDGGRELLCQTQLNGRPAFRLLRLYIHGTRVYMLTCTAAERSKLDDPAIARHFASFRFTR
jgi:hypothetical protein